MTYTGHLDAFSGCAAGFLGGRSVTLVSIQNVPNTITTKEMFSPSSVEIAGVLLTDLTAETSLEFQ